MWYMSRAIPDLINLDDKHNQAMHGAKAVSESMATVEQDYVDTIGHITMLNGRFPICPVCGCHYKNKAVLLEVCLLCVPHEDGMD